MFEKIENLIVTNKELHIEVDKTLAHIKYKYPFIYKRKKGVRVPYTYAKYNTKYLTFDFNSNCFCLKFGDNKCVGFPVNKYNKTWAFNKEDFE